MGIELFSFRAHEDLKDFVSLIKEERDVALVRALVGDLKVIQPKHEWIEDELRAISGLTGTSGAGTLWDSASDLTPLPIAAADYPNLRLGDVLLIESEIVIVSALLGSNTITVYSRGHGSTTGAAHGTAAIAFNIIGNAQIESFVAPDEDQTTQSELVNYTQIFEDAIKISETTQASKVPRGTDLAGQIAKKMESLLIKLDRAMIWGVLDAGTSTTPRTMGGLVERVTTNSVNASAAALTLDFLYNAVQLCQGSPDMLIMGKRQTRALSGLMDTKMEFVPESPNRIGSNVLVVQTPFGTFRVIVDANFDDAALGDEIYVINSGLFNFGFLHADGKKDRAFKAEMIAGDGGDFERVKLTGEYTDELRNEKGFSRLFGLAT